MRWCRFCLFPVKLSRPLGEGRVPGASSFWRQSEPSISRYGASEQRAAFAAGCSGLPDEVMASQEPLVPRPFVSSSTRWFSRTRTHTCGFAGHTTPIIPLPPACQRLHQSFVQGSKLFQRCTVQASPNATGYRSSGRIFPALPALSPFAV